MKKFICKAKLIRKEGYEGIFLGPGVVFKLPYKDLKVGETCEVYYFKNNKKKGDFAVFRPKRVKGISLSKRRDENK